MISLIEMVERHSKADNFAGRAYRYGSRLRLYGGDLVTAIDAGYETDFPVFDYVRQDGKEAWAYDSEIVEVVLL